MILFKMLSSIKINVVALNLKKHFFLITYYYKKE